MKKIPYVLGINLAYHESSACLFVDGRLFVAVEEERFNRIRHAKPASIDNADTIPYSAINSCLATAGITMLDVTAVACSFDPENRYQLNVQHGDEANLAGWGSLTGETEFRLRLLAIPKTLDSYYGDLVSHKWHWLPHHLCHLAGAYYQSGFKDSALLCIDGIGEFSTVSFGVANNHKLTELGRINYPNSIGLLWEKFSRFLGFSEYDACKVMSLAAFGDSAVFKTQMEQLICDSDTIFSVNNAIVELRKEDFNSLSNFLSLLPAQKGMTFEQRHYDLAAALQQRTNDVLLKLARKVKELTANPRLCYSGGVALNCLANQSLCESGLFENIFIQAAANDAGTAVGAAYLLAVQAGDLKLTTPSEQIYLGSSFADEEYELALKHSGLAYTRYEAIEEVTAQYLADGNVVGWFQGRMEFGPRALGHRSILADPRNPNIKIKLDEKIKFRDAFRPYGPSVLDEYAPKWFDIPEAAILPSTVMLTAPKVKSGLAQLIPAVIHHDDTSRLQLVNAQYTPRYHRLITCFYQLTNVPMILNTSFNSCDPLVQSPDDAIKVFLNTEIDILVLGNYLVSNK